MTKNRLEKSRIFFRNPNSPKKVVYEKYKPKISNKTVKYRYKQSRNQKSKAV